MATLPYEELVALVLLNRVAFGGGRRVLDLLEAGTPPSAILARIRTENFLGRAESLEKIKRQFDPEREIERCHEKGIRCLTYVDPDYPSSLREIPDPPILLYLRGQLSESDQAALAIVGSRLASFYGLTQAARFAKELAREGLTIVSGLAKGIDQAAHQGALEIRYGRSIAVLGCGVDVVYPRENRKIYEALMERGAILSECALGTPPLADHFPRRNRIIAGLSLGVLVVEAHERSGSLITAREGLEQGRDVFAVPGPVDQLTSRGTHRLLKEGAFLAENPVDILEILAPSLWPLVAVKAAALPREREARKIIEQTALNEEEEKVAGILSEPLAHDEIAKRLSFPPGRLAASLLELELKKKIQKLPNGRFALVK